MTRKSQMMGMHIFMSKEKQLKKKKDEKWKFHKRFQTVIFHLTFLARIIQVIGMSGFLSKLLEQNLNIILRARKKKA